MIESLPLWWAVPGVIAGTTMPLLNPQRCEILTSQLEDFADDLSLLHQAGIRAIVSLLDFSHLAQIYSSAGFAVHAMPIPDGDPPSSEQFDSFLQFMTQQRLLGNPVVVHCVAGRGRTGTIIAGYLISQGASVASAIAQVRELQPGAIETSRQEEFLRSHRSKSFIQFS